VPYFYLAGVSKSGTSDLYDVIARHPDVIRTGKEQHWFDRDRYHTSAYRQKGVWLTSKNVQVYNFLSRKVTEEVTSLL
jgi:hypothetical protein